MTPEEKAKAYDEAKLRMKIAFNSNRCTVNFMNEIFPELKENEDERIRKEIINYLQCQSRDESTRKDVHNKWITWLEKQGEQKDICETCDHPMLNCQNFPCNKKQGKQKPTVIIPKFRIGDTIHKKGESTMYLMKIERITDGGSYVCNNERDFVNIKCQDDFELVEQKPADKVETKFKVKYAGHDYNVLEIKDIAGVTFYGIEDEPNHIDYIKAENCERVDGYNIKESGSLYPTKSAMFSKQNPIDKVEPKFNIGDWIIDVQGVSANQIIGYEDDSYYIETSCSKFYLPMKLTEKNYRLWTIADAKDGDVLCCESGWTCIFKALDNHTNTFSSYSFMDKTGWFCETGSEAHTLEKAFIKAYNGNIFPATKEQRELLFSKMKEAGYEWDANHKQLKKIEQKPAWSEEDEEILRTIISDGIRGAEFDMLQIDWLKSLKDRVLPQPMQEWTAEDEEELKIALDTLVKAGQHSSAKWLKNVCLVPQNTWKPSDEQMKVLEAMLTVSPQSPTMTSTLIELYEDLNKLRGE